MSRIEELYFNWLIDKVCNEYQRRVYDKLLRELHSIPFTWSIDKDENRAIDGKDMRDDWARGAEYDHYISRSFYLKECSVLEMMIALSERCEDVMGDLDKGDRSYIWFWKMIHNLGLDFEENDSIDISYVDDMVSRMINHQYNRNGSDGGLFVVYGCRKDLRKMELWYQMHTYLNTIAG